MAARKKRKKSRRTLLEDDAAIVGRMGSTLRDISRLRAQNILEKGPSITVDRSSPRRHIGLNVPTAGTSNAEVVERRRSARKKSGKKRRK